MKVEIFVAPGLMAMQHEVMLFAATGLLIGGIDDALIDILYLIRAGWRRLFVYSRHPRMTTATLPPPTQPGPLAVFLPAWHEAEIIGATLRGMLRQWQGQDFRLFVGTYPNDAATIDAVADVAAGEERIQLVIHDQPGPTTKADCLNRLWSAMLRDEAERQGRYKAIVLHDAEDVVHTDELRLLSVMIERFDMVQLPVRPLMNQNSQWIAGHYADEFAESHGKYMIAREALGAAVPSAGVGCAFSRDILVRLAADRGETVFDPYSLTEDYEIGLHIANLGGRTVFVRMQDADGELVCTQEHFPDTLEASVRQKARWMTGIALAGWDRMGWQGGVTEVWMRLHDRRAPLSAIVLFAAYLSTLLYGAELLFTMFAGRAARPLPPFLGSILSITGMLMFWRLSFRAWITGHTYGWRQGLMAPPRAIIANIIALLAARRAMTIYIRQIRGGTIIWDKTMHRPISADRTAM